MSLFCQGMSLCLMLGEHLQAMAVSIGLGIDIFLVLSLTEQGLALIFKANQ